MRHHAFQWHITHRCNLRCTHCYQGDYTAETSQNELFAILDQYGRFLEGKDLFGHVFLTGGEPLAHPAFFPLIEEIRRRGLALTILTNGTLIGPREARRIAALGPCPVQISLDGPPEIHDAIRGEGSFEKAMRGVDHLKDAGVFVMISFTAQKGNYRSFPALARICRDHGVDKLWWDRVVTETPQDTQRLALTTGQFKHMARTAAFLRRFYKGWNGKPFVSCERSLQFLGCRGECGGYLCKAGGDMLIVLADGTVMPCRRLPFTMGNVRDGEFDELIEKSEIMRALGEAARSAPAACEGCPYTDRCNGGAKCVTFGQTGEWNARDVNCFVKLKSERK